MNYCINFDLDGTLIKSMHLNYLSWNSVLIKKNVKIHKNDYYINEGLKGKDLIDFFAKKYQFKFNNYPELWKKKDEYFKKNYKFSLYPNVISLIKKLKKNNIKISIVTAGNKSRVKKILPRKFQNFFDLILTAEDYKKSKPNPEPYIKACKILKCNPKKSFVIENAPLGITSGKLSGCTTIAITNTLNRSYLKDADIIINNFSKIFYLSQLN